TLGFPLVVWAAADSTFDTEDAPLSLAVSPRASASTATNPARARVLRLLSLSHARDENTARVALEELESLGVTGSQLELGRRMVHPDVQVRRELAQSLPHIDSRTQRELASELSRDPDETIRIAAAQFAPAQSEIVGSTFGNESRRPPVLRRPG